MAEEDSNEDAVMEREDSDIDMAEVDCNPDRVKLYVLEGDNQWGDHGVGLVRWVTKADGHHIIIHSETDSSILLNETLSLDVDYRRVRSTIITWQDPTSGISRAISFQATQGCYTIWNKIAQFRRGEDVDDDMQGPEEEADMTLVSDADNDGIDIMHSSATVDLPAPQLENLEQILNVVASEETRSEDIANAVLENQGEFVCEILGMFDELETLGLTEKLVLLFNIVKHMVCLNNPDLILCILHDDNFPAFVGLMEYDPNLPFRPKHRHNIATKCTLKQVVPYPRSCAAVVRHRIHQSFRISLVRDVLLPTVIDDGVMSTLSSLTYLNNTHLLMAFVEDPEFGNNLVAALHGRVEWPAKEDPPASSDTYGLVPPKTEFSTQLVDVLRFILSLCKITKVVMPTTRNEFFTVLGEEMPRVLPVMEGVFKGPGYDRDQVLACFDILCILLTHNPAPVREYIASAKQHPVTKKLTVEPIGEYLATLRPDSTLFTRLWWFLLDCKDTGLQARACDVVRLLLNIETMGDNDTFLDFFYQHYAGYASRPFHTMALGDDVTKHSFERKNSNALVCEVLAFCVRSHTFRVKYLLLRTGLLGKVLSTVLRYPDKHIALAGIRFFKACIGLKDEFYNRDIIKHKLFALLFDAFKRNGRRANLLNSAILELVNFIKANAIASLTKHIVTGFPELAKEVDYVDTFKQLQEVHRNASNGSSGQRSPPASRMQAAQRREFQQEAEMSYFEDESSSPLRILKPTSPVSSPGSPGSPPLSISNPDGNFIERSAYLKPQEEEAVGVFTNLMQGKKSPVRSPKAKSPKVALGAKPPAKPAGGIAFKIGAKKPGPRNAFAMAGSKKRPMPRVLSPVVSAADDEDDEEDEMGPGAGSGSAAGAADSRAGTPTKRRRLSLTDSVGTQ